MLYFNLLFICLFAHAGALHHDAVLRFVCLSVTDFYCNNKLSCRRETARFFLSLNISSHLRSLKIIQNDTLEWGVL